MYRHFAFILAGVLLLNNLFAADDKVFTTKQLRLLSVEPTATHMVLPDLDWRMGKVDLGTREYDMIQSDLEGERRIPGAPQMPSTSSFIAVPASGEVEVTYTFQNETILTDVDLAPFIPVQLETQEAVRDLKVDGDAFHRDAWYPVEPVINHGRAQIRDLHLINVEVTPFQYNPVRKELRVLEGVEIAVNHDEELTIGDRPVSRFFEPIYRSLVPNYPAVMPDDYQTPSILYITPNDGTIQLLLQNLVNWKHQKGFETTVVSTAVTGTSNTSIKNYIQTAYNTWENPPEFVVLVGDANGTYSLPTYFENYSSYGGEGDYPYTHLAGGDLLGDVIIGRLPFSSTTELSNIVNKNLGYEKMPYTIDDSWFTRAILVGDPSSSGQSTIMTSRFIDEASQSWGFDNYLVFNGSWTSQMASGLNLGASIFNYRGYLGMSGWTNSNTSSLNNGPKMPFVTILTCGTGSFASSWDEARSEMFVRVGSGAVPKGGIAAVGTATSGTHTLYNNCVVGGMYQGLLNEGLYYAGQVLERGRLNLHISYPSQVNYANIFSHWNNLMGDPTVALWTAVPQDLVVNVEPVVPVTSDYLTIEVENELGTPIRDAWVTAIQSDDNLFVSTYTNGDGLAILDVTGISTDDILITATKRNFLPEQITIEVDSTSHPVIITGHAFTEVSGNGNDEINAGETVDFTYTVTNLSDSTQSGIQVHLINEDGSEATHDLADLSAGASVTSDPFQIQVPENYPGIADLNMTLEISASGTYLIDQRRVEVIAPYLRITDLSEPGTGASSFDPGEIADLIVDLENIGRGDSEGLTAVLRSLHSDIEVIDSTASFYIISSGGSGDNGSDPFQIDLGSQLTVGIQAPLEIIFTDANGYTARQAIQLPIGTPGVGDPLGPDAGGYFCYDDGDLAYALAPVYNWIEIAPGEGGFPGTLVPLSDNGANQEDIHTVDLPFNFGFYGIDYNQVSIASNGYVALGHSDQSIFRNWRVPGPLGPSPMIAAFWDDLVMGGGDVYTYFNAAQNYFVIEFHEMENAFNDAEETFQIILYHPDYYGSLDGNGDILIQYKVFNNDDQGTGWSSSHGNYATIGLENQDATIGLEYTYNNSYPVPAKVLHDESAILFTTRTDAILPCPGWALSDINHDGQRNVQDIVILVNILLGSTTAGECEFWAADMSGDSTLTVGDVIIMVNNIMGLSRSTSDKPVGADLLLDGSGLQIRNANDLGGFLLEVNSAEEPRFQPVDGWAFRKSNVGRHWRMLGYRTGEGPDQFQVATFNGQQASFIHTEGADRSGAVLSVNAVTLPESFAVTSVYPNPFNPTVRIEYEIPEAMDVSLQVYNALGQQVHEVERSHVQGGRYSLSWDAAGLNGQSLSAGLYFARLETPIGRELIKLTYMK